MRILHISTRLILGGSQENTVLSCEGQARLGHEVHLAFGPIFGPEGSMLRRVEAFNERCRSGGEVVRAVGGRQPVRDAGERCTPIATHVVPSLVREVRPVTDRRGVGRLRRLIEELKPAVVHTHSSKAGILGRIAAWGHAPAVVHTIHGPPFMPIDGGVLQSLKRRTTNAGYALAERYAARRCHLMVSVADAMTRQFLARGIGSPEQYVTVRSGMDVGPFLTPGPGQDRGAARARLAVRDRDFVIGTVARLAEHKGHDDLLDALAPDLRQDRGLKLLWVGDGWWRRRLLERARGLGLEAAEIDRRSPARRDTLPQLILTGLVPQDEIPGLIRAMDLLAHPSYREGLPRTLPQALLCGVPVVAYDSDGAGEVCFDPASVGPARATGRLVPTGDVPALREAVRWMRAHPDERAAMARSGRELCRHDFDAELMVARLEEVYERAAARG